MRGKLTYYQKIKINWNIKIINRRKTQSESVRKSIMKANKKNYIVANMMRNILHLNSLEIRRRDENEKRIKTAKVNTMRNNLRTSQEITRRN